MTLMISMWIAYGLILGKLTRAALEVLGLPYRGPDLRLMSGRSIGNASGIIKEKP
jgi:hypothetical protein